MAYFDKMEGQAVYEASDAAVRQETEAVSNGSRWNANWFLAGTRQTGTEHDKNKRH